MLESRTAQVAPGSPHRRPMPASVALAAPAPSDLAWRVIGLVNLYRLLVPPVLLAMHWSAGAAGASWRRPSRTCSCPPASPISPPACCWSWRAGSPGRALRRVALLNAAVDALACRSFCMPAAASPAASASCWCCPVGAMAVLADNRDAFLIAAMRGARRARPADLRLSRGRRARARTSPTPGVLGVVLFTIALAVWPIANRLRESEALVRRQEVDLANLAQLSQYIVQHLRESILVVDSAGSHPAHQRIRGADARATAVPIPARCSARPRRACCICWRPGGRTTGRIRGPERIPSSPRTARASSARTSPRSAARTPRPCWSSSRTRA